MHRRGGNQMGIGSTLTPMVQRLMIANAVVFFLQMFMRQSFPAFDYVFGVTPELFFRGMIWQPFTYMWLHAGLGHIFMNMFVLWMFGPTLESLWGSKRFLRFYLMCGVGAGAVILGWNLIMRQWGIPTIGASGAIYGLLTAFALTWPDRTIMLLFPPMPVKAIWFIPLLFVMQIALGGGNISHAGHLGGVIVAVIMMRKELSGVLSFSGVRFKWHRWKMRRRLRAVQRDDVGRRRRSRDDDHPPTIH